MKSVKRTNLAKAKKFTDMLNAAINKYNKRAIETSKVIEELIALAKEMNDSYKAGEGFGLIKEEVAFYDALASHETAEQVLGDDILKVIAHELTQEIKENMNIELKENEIEYTLKISANNSFSSDSNLINAFELGIRLIVNPKNRIHLDELVEILRSNKIYANFNDLRNSQDIPLIWVKLFEVLNKSWNLLIETEDNINFSKVINELENVLNDDKIEIDEYEKLLIYEDIKGWRDNWDIYIKKSASGERSLGNFVRSVSLGNTSASTEKGITLTTVHMSKGLEYDVVFIMGMNEGVFPDYRAISDEKQLVEENTIFL